MITYQAVAGPYVYIFCVFVCVCVCVCVCGLAVTKHVNNSPSATLKRRGKLRRGGLKTLVRLSQGSPTHWLPALQYASRFPSAAPAATGQLTPPPLLPMPPPRAHDPSREPQVIMCEIDEQVCKVAKEYFAKSTATALINESKPKFELVGDRAPLFSLPLFPTFLGISAAIVLPLHPSPPPLPAPLFFLLLPALYGRCSVHGAAQE
jgi:hypothetical protein